MTGSKSKPDSSEKWKNQKWKIKRVKISQGQTDSIVAGSADHARPISFQPGIQGKKMHLQKKERNQPISTSEAGKPEDWGLERYVSRGTESDKTILWKQRQGPDGYQATSRTSLAVDILVSRFLRPYSPWEGIGCVESDHFPALPVCDEFSETRIMTGSADHRWLMQVRKA